MAVSSRGPGVINSSDHKFTSLLQFCKSVPNTHNHSHRFSCLAWYLVLWFYLPYLELLFCYNGFYSTLHFLMLMLLLHKIILELFPSLLQAQRSSTLSLCHTNPCHSATRVFCFQVHLFSVLLLHNSANCDTLS